MKIDHLAIWTKDIDALVAFYARYFDVMAAAPYENPRKGFVSRFVRFRDGGRIEFMCTTSLQPVEAERGVQRMGLTHFAISVGSETGVDELTARLHADGHPVIDGPRRTGDGYYESVVLDPDGNRVEITA